MLLGARIRSLIPEASHSAVETMGLNKLVPSEAATEVAPDRDQIQKLEAKLATAEGQLKASETKCIELTDKCAQLEDKYAQSEEKLRSSRRRPSSRKIKSPVFRLPQQSRKRRSHRWRKRSRPCRNV